MNKRNLKLIMELIFIFILPLLFICFTSKIEVERQFTYDNNGNYQVSQDTKELSFDNSIIKYTDGYKNIINDFNIWDEQWELGAITNNGSEYNTQNRVRAKNYINIVPDTTYYFKIPYQILVVWFDNDKNPISYNYLSQQLFTTPSNAYFLRFCSNVETTTYNNNICINLSVSWANGSYAPYGKPLILITETDISGQNTINYTVWGNIKNLLVTNLELNDNILLDLILCYTILWFNMWIIWHLFYGLFELLWHVIPKPLERMR